MAKEKDPFAEFEDWLVDGPAGDWARPSRKLTTEQKNIVENNVALLLNRDAWGKRVNDFEAAIQSLPAEREQIEKRTLYNIRFDQHSFEEGDQNFSGYYFPCSVFFLGVKFTEGNILFSKAKFGKGNIVFSRAEFRKANVFFNEMVIAEGQFSFILAQFKSGLVNFNNTQFGKGDVSFYKAEFEESTVYFIDAQFGEGAVNFSGVRFSNKLISFENANFGAGHVNFFDANFGDGSVQFNGARCEGGEIIFSKAHFGSGSVDLTNLDLSNTTLMATDLEVFGNLHIEARFSQKTNFRRLKVKGTFSISGSEFSQVPDFRDAFFDHPPDMANVAVENPKLTKDCFWHFARASDPEDASRFRKLKAMALDASDHERDGYFFAREMRAKRGVETKSFSGLLFNTLYDWFSGYGQSFVKPFWWWVANLVSFCIYYVYIIGSAAEPLTRLYFAFHHSLRNSLPLLGGFVRYAIKPKDWQDRYGEIYKQLEVAKVDIAWLVNLGILQSIIGGILLFLFLLALRNRFRLK